MNKPLPDQADVLTENAQLELQARNLRAQLASKGKTVSAPTIAADNILVGNAALKAHVAELQTALSGTPGASSVKGDTLTARVLKAKAVAATAPGNHPLD